MYGVLNTSMGIVKRYFLIGAGIILTILGLISMLLPVMPATPFLLLAAGCYLQSSEKLYQRLITNKLLGKYIKNYREHKAIPKSSKIISISLLWLSLCFSILFVLSNYWAIMALLLTGSGITVYLLRMKTLPAESTRESAAEQIPEKKVR